MRCPKCSFVSFDLVESCVKCGKNISAAAAELQGTVAAVAPPIFLGVVSAAAPPEAFEETAGFDTEEPLDLGGESEEETMDFSFDEGSSAEAEEVEMDFGEAGETTAAADLDLGFDEEVVVEPEAGEEDVIGISDLGPVEEAEEVLTEGPAEEEHEAAAAGAGGLGLEDLKVDGIDLDSSPGGVAESGKVLPSVKTGTALDDFDFDLGDLITPKDE
jgi:hypothetical protein